MIVVVAATTVAQALATMATLLLPSIAPEMARVLQVDPSLIGYQVSIVYGGAMLSTAFGGSLVQRFGACRTTQAAMALLVIGAAFAAIPDLFSLVVASCVLGLGYGLTNPAASHLLVRFTSPKQRNFIFSVKQTGVPLGGMIAAVGAPTVALNFGWQWALAMVAGLALFLMLLLQPKRMSWDGDKDPQTSLRQQPFGGVPLVWKRPDMRWLSLAAFGYAAIQLCLMTFTVTLLVREAGYELVEAGLVLSLVQVAGVIGRLFWGWFADRINDSVLVLKFIGILSFGCALATIFLSSSWTAGVVYLVFLLFGFSAVGWNGVFLAQIAKLCGSGQVGLATGGALFFTFAGVLFGPSAFAFAYEAISSYTQTFGLLAFIALAALGCLRIAKRAMAGTASRAV